MEKNIKVNTGRIDLKLRLVMNLGKNITLVKVVHYNGRSRITADFG